jgi:hypothetical protein
MAEILNLEECIQYVRLNVSEIYPPTKHRGKTMGSIPVGLHEKMQKYALKNKLRMNELLAGLWDFYEQYEDIHATELKKQRNKRR